MTYVVVAFVAFFLGLFTMAAMHMANNSDEQMKRDLEK